MERKGGLRVGESGLIGGSPYVSLRILPSLMLPTTNRLSHSAAKSIIINCLYMINPVLHLCASSNQSTSDSFYDCVCENGPLL